MVRIEGNKSQSVGMENSGVYYQEMKLIIDACKNDDINFPNRISTADYNK